MRGQSAEFLKGTRIQQQRQPFACRQPAAGMLLLDALDSPAQHGAAAHFAQHFQVFQGFVAHRRLSWRLAKPSDAAGGF